MTLTFLRCKVMPAKRNNGSLNQQLSEKKSWNFIDNVVKIKTQFLAALKLNVTKFRGGIVNEIEITVITPLCTYKVCTHLKYLCGDLDSQIKKTNMEIEKIQRRETSKLNLWNGFLMLSEPIQQDSLGCRRTGRVMIPHRSPAYSFSNSCGEGKFYVTILHCFLQEKQGS